MGLISQEWVWVRSKPDQILITARADGYQTQRVTIPRGQGQTVYQKTIVLEDLDRDVFVRTADLEPLNSAYVERSQYGFSPHDYGITVFVPRRTMRNPAPERVQVMDDLLWVPIKKSCKIEPVEDFWKITLTVSRDDFGATARFVAVLIGNAPPPDAPAEEDEEEVEPEAVKCYVERIRALEGMGAEQAENALELSSFLLQVCPAETFVQKFPQTEALPQCLEALIGQKTTFSRLHRE